MHITNTIANFASRVFLGPINYVLNLARTSLDTITGGRGLKIWAAPALRNIQSKENFHEFKLENGLKVLVKQSKGTQVDAELIFNTGSAKDPKGREGLAHFLEHVVIHNTRAFGNKYGKLPDLHGGSMNGETERRTTMYSTMLPKDKLDLALRMLSSLMGPIELSPEALKKEQAVISSEIMMTEANIDKNFKVVLKLREMLFGKNHPLANNVIGTKESVQATTIEDLYKFHSEEYVPNNATLVISGDFDLFKLKSLIVQHFGKLKPRAELKELDLSQNINPSLEKEHVLKDDALTTSFKYIYQIPKFSHRESLVASLISGALTGGDDSRLNRKLVDGEINKGKASASFAYASPDMTKFYGHFTIGAKPLDENRDANLALIRKTIDEELQNIAENGLTEKEFQRAINRLEAQEVYANDRQHSRIGQIADYSAEAENWTKVLDRLKDLRSITNEEIKQFAQKYLNPSNRHSFTTLGKGEDFSADYTKALNGKAIDDAKGKTVEEEILDTKKFEELIRLSGGISNLDCSMHDLQKHKYANGMQLYHKEDKELPLVFVEANFEGGSLAIPKDKSATLGMLNSLLGETGTYNPQTGRTLTKQDIENLKINLGARFSCATCMDTGSINIASLSKNLDKTLALVNEILNNPAILETKNPTIIKRVTEELERQKKSSIDFLESFMKKLPQVKASETLFNAIYPKEHEFYSKPIEEAIKEIRAVKLDDIRALYKTLFHAKNAQITAVGDISKADIDSKIVPLLDNWNKSYQGSTRKTDYSRIAAVEPPKASIKIIQAQDNKPETTILIANPSSIKKDDPDFYHARIADMILGSSSLSSRLMKSVREEKGLAYHIGSSLTMLRNGSGPFMISLGCDPKNTKKAIAATLATVKDFLTKGITEQELEFAKSQLKKGFALYSFNSRSSTCGTLSDLQLRNKDENHINNYSKMIDDIKLEDVMKAARKFIRPQNFTIVATKPKDFTMEKIELQGDQALSDKQTKPTLVAA